METIPQEGKEAVSFRFNKETKSMLALLAEATGRTQTALAETAIEQFCDIQKWQIGAINDGIQAADAKRLVSHNDIKSKWEDKRANIVD